MRLLFPWAVCLSFLLIYVTGSEAGSPLPDEDTQDVLAALEEADLAQDVFPSEDSGNHLFPFVANMDGQWDSRLAMVDGGNADVLSRLKINTSKISLRARWRQNREGIHSKAFTAGLKLGSFDLNFGGVGLAAGCGLLVSKPGRGAGLAAGQALSGAVNGTRGWAAAPVRQSAMGVAGSWHSSGWMLMGLFGSLEDSEEGKSLGAAFVQKRFRSCQLSAGVSRMGNQQGISLSGQFRREQHRMGFEWVSWEIPGRQARHGVWLVTTKTEGPGGIKFESEWAASDGTAGPLTGTRPAALDTWSGSGWVLRTVFPPFNSWRLKFLYASGRGNDWSGSHRNRSRRFVDILCQGRPFPQWQVSGRWHHRVRASDAWSEEYPWLPPQQISEESRAGLTFDMRKETSETSWIFSLRSLVRQGAASNGRRSLFSVRHRLKMGRRVVLKGALSSAWGEAVDLVTAISPVRGTLLPRHWGQWSSEILVGAELILGNFRLMTAASRREPTRGRQRDAEHAFWASIQSRW